MNNRISKIARSTKETKIALSINLDKAKPVKIKSTIPFMDHMLELFACHGGFGFTLKAKGDTCIDDHHLVEDLGIVFGQAIQKAVGNKKGINRYGSFLLPMDESLSYVALDLSGRPFFEYKAKFSAAKSGFDFSLLKEFFYAVAINAGLTLHISMLKGGNNHHIAEAIFKGFGRALRQAVDFDTNRKGVPSTKGKL